jgi:hypothetical protein
VGYNGTFLGVSTEGARVAERLPATVVRFFEESGMRFDPALGRLTVGAWRVDTTALGIAIAPAVDGWVPIADTERKPDAALAAFLARELATPVVITTIARICDLPEPDARPLAPRATLARCEAAQRLATAEVSAFQRSYAATRSPTSASARNA